MDLCQEKGKRNSPGKKKRVERQDEKKKRGVERTDEKKKRRVESSGEFYDSHCHVDRLYQKTRHHGNMTSFFNWYLTGEGFKACIANFCDPEKFSKQTDLWNE